MSQLATDLEAALASFRSDLLAEVHRTVTAQTRFVFFPLVGLIAILGVLVIAASKIG